MRKRCRRHLFFAKIIKKWPKSVIRKIHSKKMIHTDSVMEFWGGSSRSSVAGIFFGNLVSAPCIRGWTQRILICSLCMVICPVYTGMNLYNMDTERYGLNLPRVYGDEPERIAAGKVIPLSAPCIRGWTDKKRTSAVRVVICPEYTGMNPWFLHFTHCRMRSAPCIRGWTIPGWFCSRYWRIRSVRTGMSLSLLHSSHHNTNPPRIHGDKSIPYCLRDHRQGSALHTQG